MTEQLWGGETTKAVDNFPVSGTPVPVPVVRWLGRVKAAAAEANGELGLLDGDWTSHRRAAEEVGEGDTTTSSRSTSSRPAPAPRAT